VRHINAGPRGSCGTATAVRFRLFYGDTALASGSIHPNPIHWPRPAQWLPLLLVEVVGGEIATAQVASLLTRQREYWTSASSSVRRSHDTVLVAVESSAVQFSSGSSALVHVVVKKKRVVRHGIGPV
jgi:ribosomal protein L27